jgi:hypothetical protein
MIAEAPTSLTSPTRIRSTNALRRVAAVQGVYFLLTGLWPLVSVNSFQGVTGPKMDLWLVYTVGLLITAVGVTLIVAATTGRITPEVAIAALGSAAGLAGIDFVFVSRGVISWVYLLDAAAEVGLIAWWAVAYFGPPRRVVPYTSTYPRVEALLARGQSVSPNGPHG